MNNKDNSENRPSTELTVLGYNLLNIKCKIRDQEVINKRDKENLAVFFWEKRVVYEQDYTDFGSGFLLMGIYILILISFYITMPFQTNSLTILLYSIVGSVCFSGIASPIISRVSINHHIKSGDYVGRSGDKIENYKHDPNNVYNQKYTRISTFFLSLFLIIPIFLIGNAVLSVYPNIYDIAQQMSLRKIFIPGSISTELQEIILFTAKQILIYIGFSSFLMYVGGSSITTMASSLPLSIMIDESKHNYKYLIDTVDKRNTVINFKRKVGYRLATTTIKYGFVLTAMILFGSISKLFFILLMMQFANLFKEFMIIIFEIQNYSLFVDSYNEYLMYFESDKVLIDVDDIAYTEMMFDLNEVQDYVHTQSSRAYEENGSYLSEKEAFSQFITEEIEKYKRKYNC